MNGYKFNTIAEVNNAIQTINNANNFIPIEGNVTQTLVVASQQNYNEESFYVVIFDEYSEVLGVPTEILID
jgi:hypothetical protein